MNKLDLTKHLKSYYTAKKLPELVLLEKAHYISITGKGDPSEKLYAEKIQALYTMAYAIKFINKEAGQDFVVPKLEGLWWYNESEYENVTISEAASRIPRSQWHYRILIRMPDFVKEEQLENAINTISIKKQIRFIEQVEWFKIAEQQFVRILHLGPFDKEGESLLKIAEYMNTKQLQRNGVHREIYLSDYRKTAPEKLRTILLEPVK